MPRIGNLYYGRLLTRVEVYWCIAKRFGTGWRAVGGQVSNFTGLKLTSPSRKMFQRAVAIVRTAKANEMWREITYQRKFFNSYPR
jgi:hypothetical protein